MRPITAKNPHLYGHKAILAFLRSEYGCAVTRHTVWRWARRDRDPFPIIERIVEDHHTVVVSVVRLRAWAKRNIADSRAPAPTPPEVPATS